MTTDEAGYLEQLKNEGCYETGVIEWQPGRFNESHAHDFEAKAFVLSGSLTVKCDSETTTCTAGDAFTLGPGIAHTELAGPEGVRFVFGKKKTEAAA